MASDSLNSQIVGAYGEKIVEAELLRRGWLPANVNATVADAARFDIFAQKADHLIAIQVKTSKPKSRAFTLAPFPQDSDADMRKFMVLVKMGEKRVSDQIFVIPFRELHNDIEKFRSEALQTGMKDIGMWDLHLADAKKPRYESKYGFAVKRAKWLDNWRQLEPDAENVELVAHVGVTAA